MKFGFFHDAPLVHHSGTYYSRGFGSDLWKRYLDVVDALVVSTRTRNEDHNGMVVSSWPGVSFRPISAYKTPRSLLTNFSSIYREITGALSEVDAAIVRLPSVIGWITCVAAARANKPVLIEMVGCPWDAYRFHGWKGQLIAPLAFIFTRAAVRSSTFTIYVTQNFLQRRYPTNGKSAGISDVNITTDPSRLKQRLAQVSAPRDHITLGSIGKVDLRYKGYKTAISSVAYLISKGYDVEYEIVGPGDQKELWEHIDSLGLSGKVRLRGPLSSSMVHSWFDEIDLYIQPSLTEGLPRSVIEAMSHGLPVCLSDVGGHPELVDSDFLFPAGDSNALSARIIRIYDGDWALIARRNFEKSRHYDQTNLQGKRVSFLREFRNSILEPQ